MAVYFFIAFIHWMSGQSLHDIHISICELEIDSESKALEISQRIFLDDLERALILSTGQNDLNILDPKNPKELDSLIGQYLATNFSIVVNDKNQILNYLGSQTKGDVMVVYIEVEKVKKVNSIEIKNTVLMELYPDQITLVHVKKDGKNKSLKLDGDQTTDRIDYNQK